MNKTKQRIISHSIDLFNQEGISQVTVRHIAEGLSLSPGNLTYHFPNLESLMDAIYFQMVNSMDQYYIMPDTVSLKKLHALLMATYNFQSTYHFFFSDFATVSKRFPTIATRHEKVRLSRAEQGLELIDALIDEGWLTKARKLFSYADLLRSIWLLYPAAIENEIPNTDDCIFPLPIRLTWNMIIPRLTPKGLIAYKKLRKKEELNNANH